MANVEQLAILKQGVKAWNEWREKNPSVDIDLSEAILYKSDLIEANLRAAHLFKAQLSRADLFKADLSEANLFMANLSEANLNKAQLTRAHLGEADLFKANLREANLRKAQLTGAKLGAADFSAANLSAADLQRTCLIAQQLSGANLSGALLIKADLTGAHLVAADLSGANLIGADLFMADLREAILREVDFSTAHLKEADFSGADFSEATAGVTSFDNVNLSQVRGLETVNHRYPSSIGIDTIYKSKGDIPDVFLRGCGVSEDFITFMHSLTAKAFDYYSCFISYSSKDTAFVKQLCAGLQNKSVRVWFAPEDLKIGDKFRMEIDKAIKVYDKLLIVLSENSIDSSWVEKEVEAAFEKENREKRVALFPIRLDDSVMETDQAWAADIRRTRHIGDFTGWKDHDKYQKAFERLMRDLKASEERK